MDLGKHVLDKELLDREGWRAGRVDDLLLEIHKPEQDGGLPSPEVKAILSGPLAMSRNLPGPLHWVDWVACRLYRLLGVPDPHPIEIPWSAVTAIDVVVHLDVDRREAGLMRLQDAVERHYIRRLPGA